jgi:polyisoprenoid-binding protein YceI
MTHYLAALAFAALIASAACADDKTSSAAKPAPAARPAATAQSAAPAKPAKPAAPAAKPAVTTTVLPHYTQASGSLDFTFEQAGAASRGSFTKFATTLDYDEKNLAASKLNVTVHVASLDTQDKDRDSTLVSADLFDAQKFPTATFAASSLVKGARGVEAVGKLTIRGVTRDVRLPLSIRPTANGVAISGEATIKRLDFGIGQGEWKSTEWVGDAVTLSYKVALER